MSNLSNICPMVGGWVIGGQLAMGNAKPKSRLCPESVDIQGLSNIPISFFKTPKCEPWFWISQVQNLSNLCPERKKLIFQLEWTSFWQSLDLLVRSLSKYSLTWQRSDRAQTVHRHCLDRPLTWPVFGQTLDWDWTGVGQTLDFASNIRPTNQSRVVPNFLNSLLHSHGPNYLTRLFGPKARHNLKELGGVNQVAIALSGKWNER